MVARVFDAMTGHEIWVDSQGKNVQKALFSPDGRFVATAAMTDFTHLLNAENGKLIFQFALQDRLRDVAFSPDSRYLAAVGEDNTAHVFDTKTGEQISHLAQQGIVNAVASVPIAVS